MRSIAVLTSPEVPIPAKGLAIIKSLPCETTVCVPDDAIEAMERAEACFVWDTDLTGYIESNWRAFAHLEWMHVAVTGVDSFLFPSLVESDVTMTNAAGIYNDSIAEFVSFCVLSQSKRSRLLEAQQQKHAWSHATSTAVKHSNAVIYGVGSIGRTVGRTLAGLGMNVRGIDPDTNVAEGFECIYRTEEMNEAASWADHFIICAPLTEQTRHSVNSGVFKAMKPTCHLVNVGRGPIVDERSRRALMCSRKNPYQPTVRYGIWTTSASPLIYPETPEISSLRSSISSRISRICGSTENPFPSSLIKGKDTRFAPRRNGTDPAFTIRPAISFDSHPPRNRACKAAARHMPAKQDEPRISQQKSARTK